MSVQSRKYMLILLPLAIMFLMRWLGFDGMVGQDGYAYVDYARSIERWWANGDRLPEFLWPPGYPFLTFALESTGTSFALAAQLVSILSMMLALLCLTELLTILYPQYEDLGTPYLFIFGLFSPFLFRQAMVTNSDMLAISLFCAFLLFSSRYVRRPGLKDLFFASLCLSFALFTRYVIILLAIPFILHLVYFWFKHVRKFSHWSVLLLPLCMIIFFKLFNDNILKFKDHDAISLWSMNNIFTTTFESNEGIKKVFLPNIIYQFSPLLHPGFIIMGLLFLYYRFKKGLLPGKETMLLCISYFSYTIFVSGYHDQNPRHFLPAFVPSLLLSFPGFVYLYQRWAAKHYKYLVLSVLIAVQIGLCFRALQPSLKRNLLEKQIASYMSTRISEDILYSFDIDIALTSRGIPQEVQSLYYSSIDSFEHQALILVNIPKWENQWKNMNPMINWQHVNNTKLLSKEKEFADGWVLYKINEK